MQDNPFLDPSLHVRWSALAPGQIEPSIDLAVSRAEAALAAIETEGAAPTFENTFLALDDATDELGQAWNRISILQSVADNPQLREAYNKVLPRVSAFYARIPLRPALWLRLKAFAGLPEAAMLPPVRARYVSETVAEFREAGADLPAGDRAKLEALQIELSEATQKYSENVLDATNAWSLVVTEEHRLEGLPARAKARAQAEAAAKGLGSAEKPAWRFTLQQPSWEPLMTYCADAALREEAWRASVSVGAAAPHDNTALIAKIIALRTDRARLLGKSHFADLITARRMAKSGDAALAFAEGLRRRCAPAFVRESRELEAFKAGETGGKPGLLAPWEIIFYAERLRLAEFDFDPEQLRPYLPMNRVVGGLFELARRVFGLRVVERPGVETWHPEALFYDMFDSRDRHIGSFLADWHPRESKRGGAWQGSLTSGATLADGTRKPHLAYICGNLTPPANGKPALLSHVEVQTIFHEFGHLIHQLLGDVEIKSLNGTSVAWDFVELPSQMMENWCWERESLDLFARHHETGEPIPEALYKRMSAARNFRSATLMTRHSGLAEMDLVLHMRPEEFLRTGDVEPALRAAFDESMVPTSPPAPTIIKRFTHVFADPVGYAAGFYSYKWAEVLDADAFTRFRKEGIFSAKVGAEFVDKILRRGNADDAGQLFRDFMGRDPDLGALLERNGLPT